ncbi:MAG: nucleotide exchange factor GrpE [Gammaproteobacteria bacterium]|nr:MAG: nucleotide exchange factor GrpE [Gammaproteobacteria bacterium]
MNDQKERAPEEDLEPGIDASPEGSEEEGQSADPAVALESALQAAEAAREQQLRLAAELENVRRRAARDVENAHKYGVERFASELLSVKDSMEMGLQSAMEVESGAASAVVKGFEATLKLLDQCLAKFGITLLDPDGEAFDPELHEAMAAQPSSEQAPGTVLLVVQKGYRIHERLLRPARVIVSRAAEDEERP